jgi:hypothetical protein
MKKTLLVFAAAVGLGACTFPQTTKMEPVGETQMQTQQNPDGTTSEKPASAKSSTAAR